MVDDHDGEDGEKVWRVPPVFMARIGGLPYDSVLGLRSPALAAWAEDVLSTERRLDADRDRICDALSELVHGLADEALRHELLALRRDVFNRRAPRPGPRHETIRGLLSPPDRRTLDGWLVTREGYGRLRAGGQAIHDADLERAREHLRALAGTETLRNGLVLASPTLDSYIDRYRAAGRGTLPKRLRKVERTLLQYTFRTACKTSPFSTLTPVALGHFEEGAGSLLDCPAPHARGRGHARVNVAALGRLFEAITHEPALRADLPVQVVGGWQAHGGRVRYVRRTRRLGDEEAVVNLDQLEEQLFFLSEGRILAEILDAVGAGGTARFGELVAALHEADPGRRDPQDVEAFLALLLRLGFLTVPLLRLDVHSDEPVATFADRLRGIDRVWAKRLAARLDTVVELVAAFAGAGRDRRRDVVGRVRAEFEAGQVELGLTDVRTPRTLIYEDVAVGDPAAVKAEPGQWRDHLMGPLTKIANVLPAMDRTLPDRLAAKGFFVARYGRGGRCADLMEFVQAFGQDCYEQFQMMNMRRRPFTGDGVYTPHENWFRLPEVTAVDRARLRLLDAVRSAAAGLPAGAEEVELSEEALERVAGELSGLRPTLDPRSFFLQLARTDGAPRAVLNRSYSGLTMLFSRFAHCFADADGGGLRGELAAFLRSLPPPDTVLAELVGGHDTTNLNLHPVVTAYELVCPGEVSGRPEEEQLRLEDLRLVHDTRTDEVRLWSDRLERYVVPVYLGFLVPMALSEVQRTLLVFGYTPMTGLDFWEGVPEHAEIDGVVHRPRLRCGDVVIQRRSWTVPAGGIPRRQPGEGDAEWFLRWRSWRRAHGLPVRVFVANALGKDATDQPGGGIPEFKPQYVDFDSVLSLGALEGMVKSGSGRVVITEMSPDAGELWLSGGNGRYVSELVLEMDGVRHV